ncbi:MAG: fibronectin type III domain-containing protein [Acidimicrobiales bacterium]|nr:fibronectin type III domain-containing protein [Acidimicrobiales bacterium]MCB9395614.1 fibronectin type III domain-containing protein [Acidimicrobiaceae bacterium]
MVATACSPSEQPASTDETTADATDSSASGAPAATDGATGDGTETEPTVALRSAIAFTSTSGTAFAGSITSFAVENVDDGTSDVVSVLGADAATRTEVEIAPGTYTVTPLGPSIAGGNMSLVEPLEPRTVTVDEPTADQPEQIAVVDFDVSTLSNPLRMRIESLTATTVDLAWDASAMDVAGVDASVSYVVRRTDGTVAATDPSDGEAVELLAPTAHRAVAVGLDPEHQYTFTVFAQFDRNGEIAEWSMSASATTAGLGAQSVAYALAPNTIVPTTFDELNAERLDETSVRITLVNGAWTRQSATDLPLVGRAEMTDHCMIGSPILVPTSIAGDEAFYGLIASCDDAPAGLLRADSTTAVVNTAVPLNAVFSYLDLSGDIDAGCYDFESTDPLSPEQCQEGQDTDGDGLSDATEARVGSDPNVADSDGDSLDDFTEVEVLGTDPLNTDSDFDSLPDGEGALYGTDPLLADSDGDGCWDTGELDAGRNPLDPADAGGACVVPAGSPRWESNVDRTREIVRAGGPVSVPDTLGLTAPGGLATGNVQVIVLWASGDDLDVVVSEPSGAQVSAQTGTTPSGGALDLADAGGACGDTTQRAEHAAWSGGVEGLYYVDVIRRTSCDGPALAQVQVLVDGAVVVDTVVAVGIDGPIVFGVGEAAAAIATAPAPSDVVDVGELEPPADLGTGAVQVTLLWASGDDLDVFVTEPTGAEVSYQQPSSPTGGFLDVDDRGGDCAAQVERAENIFWQADPPQGSYTVRIVNSVPCGDGAAALAQVQVRVGGQLVIDQTVQPGIDAPITFDVPQPAAPSGFRNPASTMAVPIPTPPVHPQPAVAQVTARPASPFVRAPKVVCEAQGSAVFGLEQKITPKASVDMSVSLTSVSVSLEAGAALTIRPLVELEAAVECTIEDLPKLEFPALKASPIPVVVSVEPQIDGSASAKVTLSGPGVSAYAGVKASAGIAVVKQQCQQQRSRQVQKTYEESVWGVFSWITETFTKWVEEIYYAVVPCGISLQPNVSASPISEFKALPFEASLEGELGIDLGLKVTLAFGKDATVARATVGVEGTVQPISAQLEGKISTEGTCLGLNFGVKIALGLKLEALVDLGVADFGAEHEIELYEDRFQYPGAELTFGECPDD